MNNLIRGARYARGLRRTLRTRLTVSDAIDMVSDLWRRREAQFFTVLERAVWPHPDSPFHLLLANAGYAAGDVRALVAREGLDEALTRLARDGVYVSYEEYRGLQPARRGSASFDFEPASFSNPTVVADFTVQSSGTRSGGVVTGATFADRPMHAASQIFERALFDAHDVPTSVWQPAFPGFAGLNANMSLAMAGNPAEHWWSQTPPLGRTVNPAKRLVNATLPVLSFGTGAHMPRPRYQPTSAPAPVLAWCQDALRRRGRALLHGYASSLAAVATLAVEREISLDGLVMRLGNEPLTPARRDIVVRAGVQPLNSYGMNGPGNGANACPLCPDDEMHVRGFRVGLTTRRRSRPDGVEVDALLWTNLSIKGGQVWINVENDDYATLTVDDVPCTCLMGRLGMRQRVAGVRGISKVVAGGVNVPGEVFERLVDSVLPARFGGGPTDYQFAEQERDGQPVIAVRVATRLPSVDADAVREVVEAELRTIELGRMALDVWSPTNAIQVERVDPFMARSGKLMAFEPLRR